MSEILIVADLHLSDARPEVLPVFDALVSRAGQAGALYVLGDLFDYWIGDDQPMGEAVRERLEHFGQLKCPVYLQHGNRDFLIGEQFARQWHVELMPEWQRIDVGGVPIGLCHGDQLCTDDVAYQAMRAQLRHPAFQRDFLEKSLAERQAIAERLRQQSRQETSRKADDITDVNEDTVRRYMEELAVPVLVHGHTHRPAIHRLPEGLRVVVGDWGLQGSLVSIREGVISLERFDHRIAEIVDQASLPGKVRDDS
ncbi:MAG: UDP-2,3-diacylglucosamine diphosphatase [Halothiobacillaceae bacterium]